MADTLSERVTAALEGSKTDTVRLAKIIISVAIWPFLGLIVLFRAILFFLAKHGSERVQRVAIVIVVFPLLVIARLMSASNPRREESQRIWSIARNRSLSADERAALIYVTLRLIREQREEA